MVLSHSRKRAPQIQSFRFSLKTQDISYFFPFFLFIISLNLVLTTKNNRRFIHIFCYIRLFSITAIAKSCFNLFKNRYSNRRRLMSLRLLYHLLSFFTSIFSVPRACRLPVRSVLYPSPPLDQPKSALQTKSPHASEYTVSGVLLRTQGRRHSPQ